MNPVIFDFSDYKDYLRKKIASLPRKGRGELGRVASHLRMHPTRISQVLKGSVHLTLEQASSLCTHFGFSPLESDYFLLLVQIARAGTKDLEIQLIRQQQQIRERAKQLVHRLPREKILTDEQKAVFYSSWYYSGIRLATSLETCQTIEELADHFHLSRNKVRGVVDFLLQTGLCIEANGKLKIGPLTTHLEHESPLALRHHGNWRLKGWSRHETLGEGELAYTCPVSIREKDLHVIKEMLTKLIEHFLAKVTDSDPPDTLACLNIDWFKV